MSLNILILDPGSSSLKFGVYSFEVDKEEVAKDEGAKEQGLTAKKQLGAHKSQPEPTLIASGAIDRLGSPQANLKLKVHGQQAQIPNQNEKESKEEASYEDGVSIEAGSVAEAVEIVLRKLQEAQALRPDALDGVGCRVVHGGDRFVGPTRVTPNVIDGIRELAPLAPLHNPAAADLLDACIRHLPDVPLFAVFDTTFHRTMPDVARTYALPFKLCEGYGLHRFGFHGIAHHYVSGRLLEEIDRVDQESRCITCHLGNGASICAVRNGKSIDTSMGMTPLEGLVMGTRSGDVDPGLLVYLLRTVGMSPDVLEDLLNHKSGMLGVSGLSGDLRDLEPAAASGDARSKLALDLFAYRVAKTIGSYIAALEGLDALAFSGGIGEHSSSMRQRICRRLSFLGINLDDRLNNAVESGEPSRISAQGNSVQIWVIPSNEDLQIAREVLRELPGSASRRP